MRTQAFTDSTATGLQLASCAHKARALRTHGETSRYHHRWIGGNFRIDALQCALVRVKLRYLAEENAARRANAKEERYYGDVSPQN